MSASDIANAIGGIGDAFTQSYELGRKQKQEDDAPALTAGLLSAFGGGVGGGPTDGPTLGTLGQAPVGGGAKVPAFAGGGRAMAMPSGGSAEIQGKFTDALKAGGLTNPYGLAAMTAYAQHESQYSPQNIVGSWSDPSQSGQPGTSGGILSWRGDRLSRMRAMTANAPDPVTAQAKFALVENPDLTMALQNAKSAEEANGLMANAWRFAGFDKPGGEFANRLATTQSYATRLAAGAGMPTPKAPTQVASAAPVAAPGSPEADTRPAYARPVGTEPGAWGQADGPGPGRPQAVASAEPDAANLPAPGAAPTAFTIPPGKAGGPVMTMPATGGPAKPVPAPASSDDDDAADKPAPGAQPTAAQAAPVAPAAPRSQSFPGFGAAAGGSRAAGMTQAQYDALNAAWKNPLTRPIATQILGQVLSQKDSAWKLETVNGQSAWTNNRTGQILPVGEAKPDDPHVSTIGTALVDQRTGRVIYQGPDKDGSKIQMMSPGSTAFDPVTRQPVYTAPRAESEDKFSYQTMPGVGMVALHPTDPSKSRVIIPGQQPRAMTPEEQAQFKGGYFTADGAPHVPNAGVQVLPGERAKDQEIGKAEGGEIADYIKAGHAALDKQQAIGIMRDALDQGGNDITTGPLAEKVLALKQFAKGSLGIESVPGTTASEIISKIGTQLATANAKSLTARPTQFDFQTYLKNNPGLSLSLDGNRAMLNILAQQAQREYDLSRLASKKENQGDFGAVVDAYDKAHPIVSPFTGKPLKSSDVDAPAKLPEGTSEGQALFDARKALRARPDLRGQVEERLRSWGVDPRKLGN